jgi:lysophospholipase L1-like esterase
MYPAGPIHYVALGDSTGSGVGAKDGGYPARLFKRLVAQRPGSRLTNLCVSGATTTDLLRDQLDSAVRAAPQLVTLGIGINDIGHGLSVEEFSKNYDEILKRLRNETKAAIIVTNLPDISSAPRIPAAVRAEYQQLIVQFNQKVAEVARKYAVTVFDIYEFTHELLPSHPEFFSEDGFHPSDAGYEVWAERMWQSLGL